MNYFQELAGKYDAWFHTPHGQYVYKYENQMINRLLDLPPDAYVLDVGCGTGIYTQELLAKGARQVVGIDISPEMLAIAQYKTSTFGERVSFQEADAAQLPFPDDYFDVVISITAMEFFKEPDRSLQDMYRVLRPGGHMVVATLNKSSLWAAQRRLKACLAKTIFSSAKFYSIADIRRMMEPYTVSNWVGGIFIPPFFPDWLINHPDAFERACQRYIPNYGAFVVARIDK